MADHFSFSFENSREKLRAICLCLLAPNVTNWARKTRLYPISRVKKTNLTCFMYYKETAGRDWFIKVRSGEVSKSEHRKNVYTFVELPNLVLNYLKPSQSLYFISYLTK